MSINLSAGPGTPSYDTRRIADSLERIADSLEILVNEREKES